MKQFIITLLLCFSITAGSLAQLSENRQLDRITTHFENEEYDEVIRLLEPLIIQYDLNEGAYQILITSFLNKGQRDIALDWISKAVEKFPESLDLRVLEVEAGISQPDKALELLETTIIDAESGLLKSERISKEQLYQLKGRLHLIVGRDYLDTSDYESAIYNFKEAQEWLPENVEVYRSLFYAYLMAEDYDSLNQAYRQLSSRLQSDQQLSTLRNQALFEMGRVEEVRENYRELYQQNPDDLNNALIYGQLLIETGRLPEASELFYELLDRYPDEKRIYDFLLDLNYRTRNYEGVIALLEKMKEQFPEQQELHLEMAQAHQLNGNIDRAIAVYDSLKIEKGSIFDVVHPKAALLFQEGKKKEAYRELSEVEDRHADREIEKKLGKIASQKDRPDLALSHFSEYLTTTPDDSIALILKARALNNLGDKSASETYYHQAIDAGANWPEAYLQLLQRNPQKAENRDEWLNAFSKSIHNIQTRKEIMAIEAQIAMQQTSYLQEYSFYPKDRQLEDLQKSLWDLYEFGKQALPKKSFEQLVWSLNEQHPEFPDIYEMAGNFYQEFDQSRALAFYKNGVDVASDNRSILIAIAEIKESREEFEEAILWYERANSVDPSPEIYSALIRLNRMNGTLDQLIDRWLVRYHSQAGSDPIFKDYLVDALHRAGRSEEAREIARDP